MCQKFSFHLYGLYLFICLFVLSQESPQERDRFSNQRPSLLAGRRANNLAKHNLKFFTASPHLCYAWPYNCPFFRLFVLVDRLLASLSAPPSHTHEYIVVGAGSAGSVVAGKSPLPPRPFQNGYIDHKVKYGVRYPKFIWDPCAQLYSLAETPQFPPSSHIWAHNTKGLLVSQDRRHLFVTPCIDPLTLPFPFFHTQHATLSSASKATLLIAYLLLVNYYPVTNSFKLYQVICNPATFPQGSLTTLMKVTSSPTGLYSI
jgi:hypothetical protein